MKKIILFILIVINVYVLMNYKDTKYQSDDYIKVEIKGQVESPGVYKLEKNSRVEDVVKKAGGLNENGDFSFNNLSKKLNDEDVVIIYSKEEVKSFEGGNTSIKYIDKECVCPSINNTSLFNKAVTNLDGVIKLTGKISLNSATKEELMTLPGIGESKAKAIIEYRDSNKGFKDIYEITNVKGIGDAMYEKIKDYLTL